MAELYSFKAWPRDAAKDAGKVYHWIDMCHSPDDGGWYANENDAIKHRDQRALDNDAVEWGKWFCFAPKEAAAPQDGDAGTFMRGGEPA